MKVAALILLAGKSERFKSDTPKQFFEVDGKPLIYYTISSFEKSKDIDEITLVSKKEYFPKIESIIKQFGFKKIKGIVEGGNTRNKSVHNGLVSLSLSDNDKVLIHDGARPLVSEKIINDVVKALDKYEAVATAIKVEDTIAFSKNSQSVESFKNRDNYYRVQTPQGFRFKTIVEAHKNCNPNATDDAQLAVAIGKEVAIVLGDKRMNKITTIEDIANLESYLK